MCVCACVFARACVRACMRACLLACVRACVCVCVYTAAPKTFSALVLLIISLTNYDMPILGSCSIHTVNVEEINVSKIAPSIAQFRTVSLIKQQMVQTVAEDSAKHDGRPAIFSKDSLYRLACFVSGKLGSSSLWKAMNDISCTQPTRRDQRGGTIIWRPTQVVLSGFRRVQCVNSTVGKVRHFNNNTINRDNMTHTEAPHTRTWEQHTI